ncbi:E3 ubiquitin-protein ligase AMFR [Collichthys lucidus]|uniref:E3 ubiquitin-protein ligase AMFR n=1 Tax=Collichthys lucidus TaxID=240159 RepID=A0A4U5UGG6_COLLU|nr:E3 ubiquitin-protein ligase AMFR [Collichthys lucidus]
MSSVGSFIVKQCRFASGTVTEFDERSEANGTCAESRPQSTPEEEIRRQPVHSSRICRHIRDGGQYLSPMYGDQAADVLMYLLLTDSVFVWGSFDTACCILLIAKLIQCFVFGPLRVSEKQHLKDKIWNFIFYKFIFGFSVLNVQMVEEVVMWWLWFSVLVFLHLMVQLCRDRFEYLSFSPTTPPVQPCAGAATLCNWLVHSQGRYTTTFMAAEVLYPRVGHESEGGSWDNKSFYVYYTDLLMELLLRSLNLLHHMHMLMNWQPNNDDCAICWDVMNLARRLPCGHLFHSPCLYSWLEQDMSCPTCRMSLNIGEGHVEREATVDNMVGGPGVDAALNLNHLNHFLHFGGETANYICSAPQLNISLNKLGSALISLSPSCGPYRVYCHWLPSFSVEVMATTNFLGIVPTNPSQIYTMMMVDIRIHNEDGGCLPGDELVQELLTCISKQQLGHCHDVSDLSHFMNW